MPAVPGRGPRGRGAGTGAERGVEPGTKGVASLGAAPGAEEREAEGSLGGHLKAPERDALHNQWTERIAVLLLLLLLLLGVESHCLFPCPLGRTKPPVSTPGLPVKGAPSIVRGSSRYLVKREMLDSGAGVRSKRGTATDLQSEGRWTGTKALFRQSALRGVSCDGWSRPPQTHPEQVCVALTSAGEHGEPRPNGRRTGPIGHDGVNLEEKNYRGRRIDHHPAPHLSLRGPRPGK
ncbi:unnamed protein product [Gadus morhua 'NCC']